MFGRVPLHNIRSLDDVVTFVGNDDPGNVVIFDVDNTLVPQGVSLEEFGVSVNGAIDRFETIPGVLRVIALTNGPERGVPRMVSRGNKPWTTRRRLGLRGVHKPIIVVGDQLLTDGLLAWRLGATHLHLVIDSGHEASRQVVMRQFGRLVERCFFRTAT